MHGTDIQIMHGTEIQIMHGTEIQIMHGTEETPNQTKRENYAQKKHINLNDILKNIRNIPAFVKPVKLLNALNI
jgi:hypothetical protein